MSGILGAIAGIRSTPTSPATLTFVGSRVVNATTVTLPVGTAAGDIAILSNTGGAFIINNAPPPPTGWTPIHGTTTGLITGSHSYKLLNSSDVSAGSITIGTTYGSSNRKILITVRPSRTPLALVVRSPNAQGTPNAPANQTLSISAVTSPIISFATYYTNGSLGTAGSSVTMTLLGGSNHAVKYLINNSAPANITLSMADEGSNILMSFALEVI
jgi:hypothetical protein